MHVHVFIICLVFFFCYASLIGKVAVDTEVFFTSLTCPLDHVGLLDLKLSNDEGRNCGLTRRYLEEHIFRLVEWVGSESQRMKWERNLKQEPGPEWINDTTDADTRCFFLSLVWDFSLQQQQLQQLQQQCLFGWVGYLWVMTWFKLDCGVKIWESTGWSFKHIGWLVLQDDLDLLLDSPSSLSVTVSWTHSHLFGVRDPFRGCDG